MVDSMWLLDIVSIISIPYQLVKYVMFSVLDFVAFQVLQLGPYLPIEF